jgi:hypothetical protein
VKERVKFGVILISFSFENVYFLNIQKYLILISEQILSRMTELNYMNEFVTVKRAVIFINNLIFLCLFLEILFKSWE